MAGFDRPTPYGRPMTTHLSQGTSGALRTFAGWVARGSVGQPILDGIDYWDVLRDHPSEMETIFAIFANVLELDDDGNPVNARHAEERAAVELYRFCTGELPAGEPDIEGWEAELF
jgi:hypothetical protein